MKYHPPARDGNAKRVNSIANRNDENVRTGNLLFGPDCGASMDNPFSWFREDDPCGDALVLRRFPDLANSWPPSHSLGTNRHEMQIVGVVSTFMAPIMTALPKGGSFKETRSRSPRGGRAPRRRRLHKGRWFPGCRGR